MDQTNLYKKGSLTHRIMEDLGKSKTVSDLFMHQHEIQMAKALLACVERLDRFNQSGSQAHKDAKAALDAYEKEASRRYWQDAKEWRNV